MISKEFQTNSIVLVGKFNPIIFQPDWFALQNLLSITEVEKANVLLIHQDVVDYSLPWLRVLITRNKCTFATSQEDSFEPLRDLVDGTFRILSHTPIEKLGINYELHYRYDNDEDWHAFGDLLAPKNLWKKFLKKPGLASLTIQSPREDEYNGHIQIKVGPSLQIKPGILIDINDHYEAKETSSSNELMEILLKNWSQSNINSKKYVEEIIKYDGN